MEQEYKMNSENNETKIIVAEINSQAEADRLALINQDDGIEEPEFSEEAKANLMEKMRQFNEKLKLDKDKLAFDKTKHKEELELKERISKRQLKNKTQRKD